MKVGDLVMEKGTNWIAAIVALNHVTGLHRVLWFNNNKECWVSGSRITTVKKCP
jgi:hypothetical protein